MLMKQNVNNDIKKDWPADLPAPIVLGLQPYLPCLCRPQCASHQPEWNEYIGLKRVLKPFLLILRKLASKESFGCLEQDATNAILRSTDQNLKFNNILLDIVAEHLYLADKQT